MCKLFHINTISPSLIICSTEHIFETDNKNTKNILENNTNDAI